MKMILLFLLMACSLPGFSQDGKSKAIEAAMVATADFRNRLSREPMDWDYAAYVSNIDNYNIGISSSDCCFYVVFLLRRTDVKINGGGGLYTVDKKKLKLLDFVGYK